MTRIARNYSMCGLRYFLLLADKLGEARFGRWGSHVCTTSRESGDNAFVTASGNFYPRGATHRSFREVIDDEDRPERKKGKHSRLLIAFRLIPSVWKSLAQWCKFNFIRTTIRNRVHYGIVSCLTLKRIDSLFARYWRISSFCIKISQRLANCAQFAMLRSGMVSTQ